MDEQRKHTILFVPVLATRKLNDPDIKPWPRAVAITGAIQKAEQILERWSAKVSYLGLCAGPNPRYRKLLPLLPRLRQPLNSRSVEQELESWQAEADADPERKRQLFAVRYYLHELLKKVTDEWLKQTSRVVESAIM